MYPYALLPFKNQADQTQHPPLCAAEAVHFVSSSALRVIRFARCVMIVAWIGCGYEVEAAARSSSWMDNANEGADSPSRGITWPMKVGSGVAACPGVGVGWGWGGSHAWLHVQELGLLKNGRIGCRFRFMG